MLIKRQYTWLFFFLAYGILLHGQQYAPGSRPDSELDVEITPEDTVTVRSFHLTDIRNLKTFSDTSLTDIEIYSRARNFDTGAYTLGNLGSAQYPLIY